MTNRELAQACQQFRNISSEIARLRSSHRRLGAKIRAQLPKGKKRIGQFEVHNDESLRVFYRP